MATRYSTQTFRIAALCLGLFVSLSVMANNNRPFTDTRGSLSGSWYDPSRNGEGFIFEFGSNPGGPAATVFWFTHLDGGPYWLIGSLEFEPRIFDQSGLLEFTMLEVSGTSFGDDFEPDELDQLQRGTLSFVFDSCNRAFATWAPDQASERLGNDTIEYQLQRITLGLDGVACEQDSPKSDDGASDLMDIQGPKVVSVGESFRVTAEIDSSDTSALRGSWLITTSDGQTYKEIDFSGSPDKTLKVSEPGLYTLRLEVTSPQEQTGPTHHFAVATELMGNVIEDTKLTLDQSPYRLMESIQVRQETALSLEPGVLVFGEGHSITVFGDLLAQGTTAQPIVLHETAAVPGATQSDGPFFSIEIDNVAMIGGTLYAPSGSAIYGSLQVRESLLLNLQRYLYVWYPIDKTILHRNVFWGTGEIAFGVRNVEIDITNNLFANYKPRFAKGVIQNWANIEDAEIMVTRNSFLDTGRPTLDMRSSGRYSAEENYWGTTDAEIIQSMINDAVSDFSLPGIIEFRPFLIEADHTTPTLRECRERIQTLPKVVIQDLPDDVCL